MPKPKPSPPPLIDVDLHAESFRQVREAHRVALVEDYVELISDLIRDGGAARQVDIAARLGVAQPTLAKMTTRTVKAARTSGVYENGVYVRVAIGGSSIFKK